jgi:hypothetical protein
MNFSCYDGGERSEVAGEIDAQLIIAQEEKEGR